MDNIWEEVPLHLFHHAGEDFMFPSITFRQQRMPGRAAISIKIPRLMPASNMSSFRSILIKRTLTNAVDKAATN